MRISDDEFDAAVAEALDGVPERFKAVLHNIAITVADEPTDRERGTMADPARRAAGTVSGCAAAAAHHRLQRRPAGHHHDLQGSA